MQEAVHRAADWPDGRDCGALGEKSRDLELTALNSQLLEIKFLIRTKLGSQIEEYSTPHDVLIGKTWKQWRTPETVLVAVRCDA
jgi:hypothetical protein